MAKPGTVRVSRMLDVRLQNLKDSGRVILNDSQVHLFHGSAVLLAKVVLFGREQLKPGESCYAQLRLTEPIASKNGDRFVIRFFSPLETIGGGVILDDQPRRHKRSDSGIQKVLEIKESGSRDDLTVQLLAEFGTRLPTAAQLMAKLQREEADIRQELYHLCSRGLAMEPLTDRFIAATAVDKVWKDCQEVLGQYHRQNPLHAGIQSAELRQKLCKGMERTCADALISILYQEGKIRKHGDRYALSDFTVTLTKRQRSIREKLLGIYSTSGIETPITEHIMEGFPSNQGLLCVKGKFAFDFINHKDRLKYPMVRKNGKLVRASWNEALNTVAKKINEVKAEYGPDAIAGFSSARTVNEDNYLFQKFLRAAVGTNNVDHCARL